MESVVVVDVGRRQSEVVVEGGAALAAGGVGLPARITLSALSLNSVTFACVLRSGYSKSGQTRVPRSSSCRRCRCWCYSITVYSKMSHIDSYADL